MINKRIVSHSLLYTSVGGLAGLIVCAVFIWIVESVWHPETGYVSEMIWSLKTKTIFLYYSPIGFFMGFAMALIEPVNDTSWKEALTSQFKWLLLSSVFGVVAMLLAGFAGEWIFDKMIAAETPGSRVLTKLGQIIGMLILGLFLGSGVGFVDRLKTRSLDRLIAGILGGCLGGLLAGGLILLPWLPPAGMPIFPTIVLVMFVGGAIGSVAMMRTDAVLTGMPGNRIFKYSSTNWKKQLLSDTPNYIGSGLRGRRSGKANFLIANDLDVVSEHAILEFNRAERRWRLKRWSPDAVKLYVNDRALVGEYVYLQDGDVITLGGTRFRFVLTK